MYTEKREQLTEGQFRFDAMGKFFESMNVQYAFASEDCTGVIQKVCYDRQSNSFVGFLSSTSQQRFSSTLIVQFSVVLRS